MREIYIKSTTSPNKKRRNISMTEVINENGVTAKAEKKYNYYISEKPTSLKPEEVDGWMHDQIKQTEQKGRHVFIKRIYDERNGNAQIIYRVIGGFYVVQNLHIFAVVFMHSIKYDLLGGHLPNFPTH